ncbi:MAG: hypothetical protein B1H05_05135, partial [Candidatus Cloacimonas sp. 4484_140]
MGSVITALLYHGTQEEGYSPFNHFISELGQRGVSEYAGVFNIGLIIGGLLCALFMIGLGLYIKKFYSYIASAVGVVSCIFCGLVGVFPMNNMSIHVPVALTFFRSGLLVVLLFTLIFIFDKQRKISKWMIIPGGITVLAFAAFLFIPKMLGYATGTSLSVPEVRPAFWLNQFLEWLVFLTVICWVLSLSVY